MNGHPHVYSCCKKVDELESQLSAARAEVSSLQSIVGFLKIQCANWSATYQSALEAERDDWKELSVEQGFKIDRYREALEKIGKGCLGHHPDHCRDTVEENVMTAMAALESGGTKS